MDTNPNATKGETRGGLEGAIRLTATNRVRKNWVPPEMSDSSLAAIGDHIEMHMNFPSARYDSSYRISGNFLNWIATIHGREVIWKLNAAARDGTYSESLWQDLTGESLERLGEEWKTINRRRLVRAGLLPGGSNEN